MAAFFSFHDFKWTFFNAGVVKSAASSSQSPTTLFENAKLNRAFTHHHTPFCCSPFSVSRNGFWTKRNKLDLLVISRYVSNINRSSVSDLWGLEFSFLFFACLWLWCKNVEVDLWALTSLSTSAHLACKSKSEVGKRTSVEWKFLHLVLLIYSVCF